MQAWSQEALGGLFRSGLALDSGGWPWDYDALGRALDDGLIAVKRIRIPRSRPGASGDPLWSIWETIEAPKRNESKRHSRLKWWAARWLQGRGDPGPTFEAPVPYGRADVMSWPLGYAIECGNTEVRKIGEGLAAGLRAVIVVPYPDAGRPVYGWMFGAPAPLSAETWRVHLGQVGDEWVRRFPVYRGLAPSVERDHYELPAHMEDDPTAIDARAWACADCPERWHETGDRAGYRRALAHVAATARVNQSQKHVIRGLVGADDDTVLVAGLNLRFARSQGYVS